MYTHTCQTHFLRANKKNDQVNSLSSDLRNDNLSWEKLNFWWEPKENEILHLPRTRDIHVHRAHHVFLYYKEFSYQISQYQRLVSMELLFHFVLHLTMFHRQLHMTYYVFERMYRENLVSFWVHRHNTMYSLSYKDVNASM